MNINTTSLWNKNTRTQSWHGRTPAGRYSRAQPRGSAAADPPPRRPCPPPRRRRKARCSPRRTRPSPSGSERSAPPPPPPPPCPWPCGGGSACRQTRHPHHSHPRSLRRWFGAKGGSTAPHVNLCCLDTFPLCISYIARVNWR